MKDKERVNKNFFNKLSYVLIFIFAIVFTGIGVYALSPGSIENPGHNINSIGAPSGCASGQFLQLKTKSPSGLEWTCTAITGSSAISCAEGQVLKYTSGSWKCGTDIDTDTIGIRNIEVIYANPAPNSYEAVAYCPTGKIALSGGCEALGDNGYIRAMRSGSNWWACESNQKSETSRAFTVYIICATP